MLLKILLATFLPSILSFMVPSEEEPYQEYERRILVLNDTDFETKRKDYDNLLVNFYASWW